LLALLAGFILLGLFTWRLLQWLADTAPPASALIILVATLAGSALVLCAVPVLRIPFDERGAAREADQRARLNDELVSAWWFMRDNRSAVASDWITVLLQRAAQTAGGLRPDHLVPLRLPRATALTLVAAVLVLAVVWSARPLESRLPSAAPEAQAEEAQMRTMRELVGALPQTEARRKLEVALQRLASSDSREERRRALALAQDAMEQIRMDAAASREGLQRLSQILAGQKGLEEVAEALARGDAKRAAELLAKVQADKPAVPGGNTPDPSEVRGNQSLEQAVQTLTDQMTEPQGGRPSNESLESMADRLNEIAKQLAAANYVNEAWKAVKSPQLQGARGGPTAAGRSEQEQLDGGAINPSPDTSNKPMDGGTLSRTAAVAQGQGTEEQKGGTRMGKAIGTAQSDPVLGNEGERLDAQLKQLALRGQEQQQQDEEQDWFYTESQKRGARSEWRSVEAREKYAEAKAGPAGSISIRHRRIVKDYFMNRPEAVK
ncbi:MAG TPA: hypothetical protein VM240_06250, partial [Verrucomicrobiae bacterium]|nr:hypothetical protein [Verrucomicrobiae bacterium]